MLTTIEGLAIAAAAAAITWAALRVFERRRAALYPKRKHRGILVNAWERTPLQVAYDADLTRTATCPHLRPVERAMRAGGIDVHLFDPARYGPIIRAECHIHEAALRLQFSLPAFVTYKEEYRPEISDREDPRAFLICGQCRTEEAAEGEIRVLHPLDHFGEPPWFPSPPGRV